jgi:hypothetical protein
MIGVWLKQNEVVAKVKMIMVGPWVTAKQDRSWEWLVLFCFCCGQEKKNYLIQTDYKLFRDDVNMLLCIMKI